MLLQASQSELHGDLLQESLEQQMHSCNWFATFFTDTPATEWFQSALEFWLSSEEEPDETVLTLRKQLVERVRKLGERDYIQSLQEEYHRLFFTPGKVPVDLFESLYRSPKRLLMQESTMDVRRHYLRAGLVAKRIYSIPDDHVAIELEFIGYLAQKALEFSDIQDENSRGSIEELLAWQQEFITEHAGKWIPDLAKKICQESSDPFFQLVSVGLSVLFNK